MRFKRLSAVILTFVLAVTSISYIQAANEAKPEEMQVVQTGLGQVLVNDVVKLQSSFSPSFDNYGTIKSAAKDARDQIVKHSPNINVYIKSKNKNYLEVFNSLWGEMFKVTSSPIEGDYMRWDISREYLQYVCTKKKSGKKTYYYYKFSFQFNYYTTLAQRKQVDSKVKEILKSFKFTSTTSDYTKVKTIYDYVCKNVTYAKGTEDTIYTSWAALFKKEAVCQGYAQLLYRFLKEEGISTRLVPGYGGSTTINHGWNIIKIGKCYYNADATWDSELLHAGRTYQYFLQGDSFSNHKRMDEYSTSTFYANHPMSLGVYKVGAQVLSTKTLKSIYKETTPKFKTVKKGKVTLKPVASSTKYQIKYSKNKNFKSGTKTVQVYKTNYKLKGIKKGKRYYVKFRAYSKIGNSTVNTKWSKTKSFKKK